MNNSINPLFFEKSLILGMFFCKNDEKSKKSSNLFVKINEKNGKVRVNRYQNFFTHRLNKILRNFEKNNFWKIVRI